MVRDGSDLLHCCVSGPGDRCFWGLTLATLLRERGWATIGTKMSWVAFLAHNHYVYCHSRRTVSDAVATRHRAKPVGIDSFP